MNYNEVLIIPSRGKSGAVADIKDNIFNFYDTTWPPSCLVSKIIPSGNIRHFAIENQIKLKEKLGFYSDLQSIKSEDAITWSLFGNMTYAPFELQNRFYNEFVSNIGLNNDTLESIELWKRLPHPDNNSIYGPEVDVMLVGKINYILIECKWTSKLGDRQGINKDKNQIQIRQDFIKKLGNQVMGNRLGSIVFIGNDKMSNIKSITWSDFCNFESIPFKAEYRKYIEWKLLLLEKYI